MLNDSTDNEQAFLDFVNSIIGEPQNAMDPCFDDGIVEKYLENNTTQKTYCLGSKIVKIGRENIAERGLANYVTIEGPDEYKKYVLWPSTSLADGHDGLCFYDSIDLAEPTEVDAEQLTDLIFSLSDLALGDPS